MMVITKISKLISTYPQHCIFQIFSSNPSIASNFYIHIEANHVYVDIYIIHVYISYIFPMYKYIDRI